MSKNEIFLARAGKISGPFTAQEFESLQTSGGIDRYRWIWESKSGAWKPLDAPPPPLDANWERHSPATHLKSDGILAVCHDNRSIVSGSLNQVTDFGCEMQSHSPSSGPQLNKNSKVILNLVDPKSGKAVNVMGQLFDIRREAGGWIYRIRWNEAPTL